MLSGMEETVKLGREKGLKVQEKQDSSAKNGKG